MSPEATFWGSLASKLAVKLTADLLGAVAGAVRRKLQDDNEDCAAAVDLCLEALDYGTRPWEHLPESWNVRKQAALVLAKLEPVRYDGRVYDKLLDVMKHDEDGDVRDAAYNALVRLARVREQASIPQAG